MVISYLNQRFKSLRYPECWHVEICWRYNNFRRCKERK
jgi:hypothetical protein